jgi:hypothetical protein
MPSKWLPAPKVAIEHWKRQTSYPIATPLMAIENAISLADALGARITTMDNEIEVSPPVGAFFKLQESTPSSMRNLKRTTGWRAMSSRASRESGKCRGHRTR